MLAIDVTYSAAVSAVTGGFPDEFVSLLRRVTTTAWQAWIEAEDNWILSDDGQRLVKFGPASVLAPNITLLQEALKESGISPNYLTIRVGSNPSTTTPAEGELATWEKSLIWIPIELADNSAFTSALQARDVKPYEPTALEKSMNWATAGNNFDGWRELKDRDAIVLEGPFYTLMAYKSLFTRLAYSIGVSEPSILIEVTGEFPNGRLIIDNALAWRSSFQSAVRSVNSYELTKINTDSEIYGIRQAARQMVAAKPAEETIEERPKAVYGAPAALHPQAA